LDVFIHYSCSNKQVDKLDDWRAHTEKMLKRCLDVVMALPGGVEGVNEAPADVLEARARLR
jgi:hypothetical protein